MRNIHTQSTTIPANLNGETPPSEAALLAAGWRYEPDIPPVADGYVRQSIRLVEGDGRTGAWEVTDRAIADIEAEELSACRAAMTSKLTPALIAMASAYRTALRSLFGEGAEVNHAVTKESVAMAMLSLPANQYDARTADMLKLAFEELSAITGDGTTWTLFETIGDLIP